MTITTISRLQLLCLFLTGLSAHVSADVACTPEDLSSVAPHSNIDFATTVQPIINSNCGSCHNFRELGGLDMDPGIAVANLVNVPSSMTTAGIPRVTPFDLDKSFLFKKINCTDLSLAYGFHMPEAFEPGLPPPPALSKEDQAAFRDWIVQGALAVATPSINLGGYLSGNWYDPSPNQAGHGFQLEFTNAPGVTPGNKVLVAIWFVFTPDGGPQWVYGQGEWDPNTNTATIPAEIYTGAKFPPNYQFSDRQQLTFPPGWGTMTFAFSGCNDGTAAWDPSPTAVGMGYGSGTIPIKRLTQIAGTTCPQ